LFPWSSARQNRGDWTRWAQARRGSADGPGLCGVRLPVQGEDLGGEPGLCVEVQGGEVRRLSLQDEAGEPVAFERRGRAPGSSWEELALEGGRRLYLRVEGRTVRAYAEGSDEEVRGPCFHGTPGR
jgi:hypothetical protein